MRLRVAVLLSLLVIGGLISTVQPAQAGQWAGQLIVACQAKRVTGPNLTKLLFNLQGLTYPTIAPIGGPNQNGVLYTVLCGKNRSTPANHVKHVGPAPSASLPTVCIATVQSPNGKKHTPKAPTLRSLPKQQPNLPAAQSFANCLILALALVAPLPGDNGHCLLSDGKLLGVVHTAWVNAQGVKVWELKFFKGEWDLALGGILRILGSAGKSALTEDPMSNGPNPFAAIAAAQPDLIRKLDSCLPSPAGSEGADSFQFGAVAAIAGISPKSKV